MLSNQPACWRTTETCCETFGAITCDKLDAKGAENINAPTGPRGTIVFPPGHRSGDGRINQPMASFNLRVSAIGNGLQGFCYATIEGVGSGRDTDIVVVASRTDSFDQVGVDCRDGGKGSDRRCTHYCRIARSWIQRREERRWSKMRVGSWTMCSQDQSRHVIRANAAAILTTNTLYHSTYLLRENAHGEGKVALGFPRPSISCLACPVSQRSLPCEHQLSYLFAMLLRCRVVKLPQEAGCNKTQEETL